MSELLAVLADWQGPGVLIFAGDLLELWAGERPRAAAAFDAHAEFVDAVSAFARADGRIVLYLVGNHDGRAAWDEETIDQAVTRLGCELALAAEIDVEGVAGSAVRIEHGHSTDPANRFEDPRDPYASPLGQHIVQEFLPTFSQVQGDLLDGVETLADPRTFPAFISSRIFYRKAARESLWLLVPVALVLLLRIPLAYAFWNGDLERLRPFSRVLFIADLVRDREHPDRRVDPRAARPSHLEDRELGRGRATRWRTERQHPSRGRSPTSRRAIAGLVCGHTHHAELSTVGTGFYANTGSGTKVIDRVDTHFGFPPAFLPRLQVSWITLVAGTSPAWSVTLTQGRRALPGARMFERAMARRRARDLPGDPVQTGSYP